jgi:hypothetical protein
LGDVFLHVLPEAWASMPEDSCASFYLDIFTETIFSSILIAGHGNNRRSAHMFSSRKVLCTNGSKSAQGSRHHEPDSESCRQLHSWTGRHEQFLHQRAGGFVVWLSSTFIQHLFKKQSIKGMNKIILTIAYSLVC